MIELREYQTTAINKLSANFAKGIRRQVLTLPTGAGKTVAFSGMTHRYLKRFDKSVIICVHREELLSQTRRTLYNGFGIISEPITAGKSHVPQCKVYVAMVETVYNRLSRRPSWANHIGMVIVDECHIGNFNKIYNFFQSAFIVGVTATPLSASKKDPLKNYFDEIVVGTQISQLIEMGSLAPNETYSMKGINKANFGVKRGEYDNAQMGSEYSKSKNVQNAVDAYLKMCEGKKTAVFNVNVAHSKLVNDAFLNAGLNSKHIDGTESKDERKKIFEWFAKEDDAILNNVGIATTGFDEPSIWNVMVNRSTKSLTLWLQMCGRGSRPMPSIGKDYFRIVDMGGNAMEHFDWSADRNWEYMFHNPLAPSDDPGVAPIKECEGCGAIIPASATICKFCGHVHVREEVYDTNVPEFELLVSRIDVSRIIDNSKKNQFKDWYPFWEILRIVTKSLKHQNTAGITPEISEKAYLLFEDKIKNWCKESNRTFGAAVKSFAKEQFNKKIAELV